MAIPDLDDELRRRLTRRFGRAVEAWLDQLPPVLADLGERWQLEFGPLIQRGSISVVIRCRTAEGRGAVLKTSVDRRRIADEAAALGRWKTAHVPELLAVDESVGALLVEAIEPGTTLADSAVDPSMERVAALMMSLHGNGMPDSSYNSVADRVAHLFDSGLKNYERKPALAETVSPGVYDRGRELAMRLAADTVPNVLLHGDLTPVNILDGGDQRGLVAIDPAPCVGDPAFDAVDLLLWRATSVETIRARAQELASRTGTEARRLLAWCSAFAAMTALEIAEREGEERIQPFLELAAR